MSYEDETQTTPELDITSRLISLVREAVSPIPDHPTAEGPNKPLPHIQPCPGCLWFDRNREVWAELRELVGESIPGESGS